MQQSQMKMPRIVSEEEWKKEREKLLVKEKALTRALDALAAERRRLPMVHYEKNYVFEGPDGHASLIDLFNGHRQLVVYHFMLQPDSKPCVGCSSFVDNIGYLDHLHARNTNFVLVAPAPFAQIETVKKRMGWTVPWYSLNGNDFNSDCGVSTGFGISVFLRDDENNVYRTYFTKDRGADRLSFDTNLLDLTPYGRQEEWEDSPEGWPKTEPYVWWRYRDEYNLT